MKRYKLILLSVCVLPFVLASCNKWLDVSPEDQITEEELWSKGEGFRNALNGVYKSMAAYNLYGRNLTWGLVDALGQCYNMNYAADNATKDMKKAVEYEFEDEALKPVIETIWEEAYNTVANCNNILNNVPQADPEIFAAGEREKNMIWGEALALRAFIQFDMLRLYAAAPVTNPTTKYIPYVDTYPSLISNKKSVSECLDLIIRDLKDAKAFLWKSDSAYTLSTSNRFEVAGSLTNRFISTRGYRMNYYAACAALARVYLYAGQTTNAYNEATALIEMEKKNNYFSFRNSASNGDLKFYSDIIMGLYAPKLGDWDRAANEVMSGNSMYYLRLTNIKKIFAPDLKGSYEDITSDDYRFKYQIENYVGYEYFRPLKYKEQTATTTQTKVANYLVPMLRMSEVYYIAAEAICETNLDEAKEYLFKVKSGRGIRSAAVTEQKQAIKDKDTFIEALRNDMRRDLWGEGQLFFMFKRLNEAIPSDYETFGPSDEYFVLPVPDSEITIK